MRTDPGGYLVANSPNGRSRAHDGELPFDEHCGVLEAPSPKILQPRAFLRGYELPLIKHRIEGTYRRCGAAGLSVISDDAVLIHDLPTLKAYGTPDSQELGRLPAERHCRLKAPSSKDSLNPGRARLQ